MSFKLLVINDISIIKKKTNANSPIRNMLEIESEIEIGKEIFIELILSK